MSKLIRLGPDMHILLTGQAFAIRSAAIAIAVLIFLAIFGTAFPAAAMQPPVPRAAFPADHAARVKRGTELFKSNVRTILIDHCLDCHGGTSTKADFDLSSYEALKASGQIGDSAEESNLISLVKHADEPHMPLNAPMLPAEAITQLIDWIDLGAPYDAPLVTRQAAANVAMTVTDDHRRYWAFLPLPVVAIPEVDNPAWCRNPIDHFIYAKLASQGITPSQLADSRTLVRRAHLDLLGLPPQEEQVRQFNALDDDQWSAFVDDLLNSPQYGERWARHWMDVARFAESHGYEQDYDRPFAYHYRDFLIKAFNANMPYNQFVAWQLAGDELSPDDPLALMATGFLGAGAFPTQLTEAEFESTRYDELDDIVTTTGVAFLGLSLGCARCHDHKFDPIPSLDYYRLAATFATTIRSEVELDLEPAENQARRVAWEQREAQLVKELADCEQELLPAALREFVASFEPQQPLAPWSVLDIANVTSSGGSQYQMQADQSWLAIGSAPSQEVITIIGHSHLRNANALRIEALAHDSLPQHGPGRAGNGNFALGNLQVELLEPQTPTRNIELASAEATHQQNSNNLSVAASLDSDPISGWAVDMGGIGKDQAAVFRFSEPIVCSAETQVRVTLTFNHPNAQHAMGRFRVSLSSEETPPVVVGNEGLAASIVSALSSLRETPDESSEAWAVALKWFRTQHPETCRLREVLAQHRAAGPDIKLTKVMIASEGVTPMKHHADDRGFPHFYPQTFVLARGDVHRKGEIAEPGVLQALRPASLDVSNWQVERPETATTSYRRTALTKWITDEKQGAGALLARVIVNRVWHHHFGRGIVATPNDFGVSGDPPSHPELLEWLAADFVENGWDLKRLHRLIMTSSTYRQSNQFDESRALVDPDNVLHWRWTPRRLEAEAIRDSMLAVSGQLDATMFGPGTLDPNMRRRSVYFFIKRSQLVPMMMLFDWPEHLVSIGRRSSTTIAPQALMFLNSPQARAYATALADHLSSNSDQHPIDALYQQAFQRLPHEQERSLADQFLVGQEKRYAAQGVANPAHEALTDLCQSILGSNEFVIIE